MKKQMFKFGVLFLFGCSVVNAENFRSSFFEGDWVEKAGARDFELQADTFNVLSYDAPNKGIFDATSSLQAAIDDCASAGGGVVLVPEGKYLTGSIFLKDNVHLVLAENATLLASMDISDYPEMDTRVAGFEMKWPVAVVNVLDAENVKISGKGTINGRGKPFWKKFYYMRDLYADNGLRWAADYDCKRPRMLLISESENIHVSGVTFRESAFWTVHVLYSGHVTLDGLVIRNNNEEKGPSTDGIDIDSSEYVLVENCDIDCDDDNICIKAGRDADGLRVDRPSRYIVIRKNKTYAGAGLITFGSETSGGINHVYVHDMQADGTARGVRFKSARTRGGVIEDILIEDLKIKNTPFVFEFTMNWNPEYSYTLLPEAFEDEDIPERWETLLQRVHPPEKGICEVRDVMLSRIDVSGKCWKAFNVEGFEEAPLENFIFEQVHLHTETAGSIKHAKSWKVIDSEFIFDDGGSVELVNTSDMAPAFKR